MSNMPPPPPPAPVQKKGLHPMAWVGIGCGGIVILGIIGVIVAGVWGVGKLKDVAKEMGQNRGKTTAELMVRANKDLEKVSEDPAKGEMKIRVKSTGEEITLKYDDFANGRYTIAGKDGKVLQIGNGDLATVPAWVPRYPGAGDEASLAQIDEPTQNSGMLTFSTGQSLEDVKTFYKEAASKLSLSSSSESSFDLNGEKTLSLHFSGGKRELTVTAGGKSGEPLHAQTIYSEKK